MLAAGKNYHSNQLWDKYIEFEKGQNNQSALGELFQRIINTPNEKLYQYFTRFKNFIEAPGRKLEHYGVELPMEAEEAEIQHFRKTHERNPDEIEDLDDETIKDLIFTQKCEEAKLKRL